MIKIIEAMLPSDERLVTGGFQLFDLRGDIDGRKVLAGPLLKVSPEGLASVIVAVDDGQGPTGATYEKFNAYFGQQAVRVFP